MSLKGYSANESLERIYKMLSASANPNDAEDLFGQMDWAEALARIAQLLEGSLGATVFDFPDVAAASDTFAGVIELADIDESNARYADAVGNRALTPEGHHWSHEFGGMYVATGTANQSFTQETWVQVTGTFYNTLQNSGDVSLSNERIIPIEPSDYWVSYQISWWTWSGATPKAEAQIFLNGVGQPQTRASSHFGSSGTVHSISGVGVVDVISGSYPIDLRVNTSATSTIHIDSAQVAVIKMVGA
jgi:hypothetical protein